MRITEIKIKLVTSSGDKLLAFASVTFDRCFVVRDIKIIRGGHGLFVAMPSRKITDRCSNCSAKNHSLALYCNHCGKRLPDNRTRIDERGRARLHADIAHPINTRYRTELQAAILNAYRKELDRSRRPGYAPPPVDDLDAGPEIDEGELSAVEETALTDPPQPSDPPSTGSSLGGGAQGGKKRKNGNKEDGGGFGVFA